MKKKILAIGTTLVAIFVLIGCNQQKTANTVTPPTEKVTPTPTPAPQSMKDAKIIGVSPTSKDNEFEILNKDETTKPFDQDMTLANGTVIKKDGKIVFPEGKTLPKDDELTEYDHLATYSVALTDGTMLWFGGMSLPDGHFVFSSGTTILHDGTRSESETVVLPDKTIVRADGGIENPDGTITWLGQDNVPLNTTLKDGTKVTFDGKESVQVTRPDGTLMVPGKSVKFTDGTMLSVSDSMITQPDGTTINVKDGNKVKFTDGTTVDVYGIVNLK